LIKENGAILFRGNSLATKVIDLYMKEFGDTFLLDILKKPIESIYNEKQSCEVNFLISFSNFFNF